MIQLVESNHPALTKKSSPIENGTDVKELVEEMEKIMLPKGIGLAAPQVGINKRLFITRFDTNKVFINPIIVKKLGPLKKDYESCLSLPNVSVSVPRHEKILIEYFDVNWVRHKEVIGGMLSRVIQHEQDHLNGKLITDYL